MSGIDIKYTKTLLKKGNIIIFGTDTVNGLGCIYNNNLSLKNLYKIKNRPKDKPFILLCDSKESVFKIFEYNEIVENLINRFMPGSLTIIAKPKIKISKFLLKNGFASFRIPARKSLLNLLKSINAPIASTSLNISGKNIILKRDEAKKTFNNIHIFNNLTSKSMPSTIVKIINNKIVVLRKGKIKKEDILGKY